jgi:hypothetical protein
MVEKHGRGVVVVMSVEEYGRLNATPRHVLAPTRTKERKGEGNV